jgi:hypothetical protein
MSLPGDQMTALAERVVPIMQDYGLSGFVLIGYLSDADGGLKRVCIVNTARNPAIEDGLRPLIHAAHVWGAVPPEGPE